MNDEPSILTIRHKDITIDVYSDGAVSCRNEGYEPVTLEWAQEMPVKVGPRTHFQGVPSWQSHGMMDPLLTDDINRLGIPL